MDFQDYYKTLQVARNASQDDIKKAYRKLARKYHPDVSKEPNAESQFKAVNEAYEVLKDPEKRQTYDRFGSQWKNGGGHAGGPDAQGGFRPPPGWEAQFRNAQGRQGPQGAAGGSGFSDFFETLFGGAARGAGPRGPRQAPAEDSVVELTIDPEDAFQGATRTVTLQLPERQPDGRVQHRSRSLNVKIPRGISAGKKIRLAGQGVNGADLLLDVRFSERGRYRVDGKDVLLDLPIAPWEAALGATVTAPTMGGKVELKIRPGAQSGQKLRLKGRGLPAADGAGDQYVVLKIVIPEANTDSARALYRQMAEQLAFDPRAHLTS